MSDKKYPIGTKIRYKRHNGTFSEQLYGMTGKIVGIVDGLPLIYLPAASFVSGYSTKKRPATVQTGWDAIEILVVKEPTTIICFYGIGK